MQLMVWLNKLQEVYAFMTRVHIIIIQVVDFSMNKDYAL